MLTYGPTKLLVADTLTKLATAEVVGVLRAAMDSQLPARTMTHLTSITPGRQNRSDEAGDGPEASASAACDSGNYDDVDWDADEELVVLDTPAVDPREQASPGPAPTAAAAAPATTATDSSSPHGRLGQPVDSGEKKKPRRGKKRVRPGSSERKWALLETRPWEDGDAFQ